jgi:hypothetical protein
MLDYITVYCIVSLALQYAFALDYLNLHRLLNWLIWIWEPVEVSPTMLQLNILFSTTSNMMLYGIGSLSYKLANMILQPS